MTSLSLKLEFQLFQKDSAEELQKNRELKWLKVSLAYALAESSIVGLPAPALKSFVDIFLELAEKEAPVGEFPVEKLKTFEPPSPKPTPEQ